MGWKMKCFNRSLIKYVVAVLFTYLVYGLWGHQLFFLEDVQGYFQHQIGGVEQKDPGRVDLKDVVCVSVDDSLKRADILVVLQRILASEPAVVGINIKFEKHEFTRTDTLLENFIRENQSRIVLPYKKGKDGPDIYPYFVKSYEDYPHLGYINAHTVDGWVQTMQLEQGGRSSFALLLSKLYGGPVPTGEDNSYFIINYNHQHIPLMSSLLVHQPQRDLLKGKVVIVGVSNSGSDWHLTSKGIKPGYIILHHVLKSLLEYKPNFWNRYVWSFLFVMLSVFCFQLLNCWGGRCALARSIMGLLVIIMLSLLWLSGKCMLINSGDYTTMALWSSIPFVAYMVLNVYDFLAVLLRVIKGRKCLLRITKRFSHKKNEEI